VVASIGDVVILDNSFLGALKPEDMIPKLQLLQKPGRVFQYTDGLSGSDLKLVPRLNFQTPAPAKSGDLPHFKLGGQNE
jgi:hypothetical protein